MVDENKVRIMTEIARDEQQIGKEIMDGGTYYKKDYIAAHTMRIIWSFSLAYILFGILIFLYNIEEILLNFVGIDYLKIGIILLITYIMMLVLCFLVSKIYYTEKYKRDREIVREYTANLKLLKEYYDKNRKETVDDTTVDS